LIPLKSERQEGFTLIELMIALSIAAMVFVLSGPSLQRFYDAMEYRDAVRQIVSAARNAKRDAYISGEAVDLLIDADQNRFGLARDSRAVSHDALSPLPESLTLKVVFAEEISPDGQLGAIRFYPTGGASGGEVFVERESGSGTHLTIDWLLGEVTQRVFP
jgi:general secretion pathway protein H